MKVDTGEKALKLKEVVDEICPDLDYVVEPPVVVKSQYPRHCKKCDKYLRNNTDMACMMSRK